jgi:hypothetical protein
MTMYTPNIYNDSQTCSILDAPVKGDPFYMYPLLVSGALPYLAALPILLKPLNPFQKIYLSTMFVSTTLGLLWHYLWEPEGYLMFANCYATFCWFLLDVLWSKLLSKKYIIIYNIDIFAVYCFVNVFATKQTFSYIVYHSIWHVLFAMKAMYVSYLIWKYDNV